VVRGEYMHVGSVFIFREGNCKMVGRILRLGDDSDIKQQPNTAIPNTTTNTSSSHYCKGIGKISNPDPPELLQMNSIAAPVAPNGDTVAKQSQVNEAKQKQDNDI